MAKSVIISGGGWRRRNNEQRKRDVASQKYGMAEATSA